jgi:phosphoribosylaminoimidazolecarboxamide formyltransferase / IMP cyclohydrolase
MTWMLDARSHDSNSGGGKSRASQNQNNDHSDLLSASKNVPDLLPIRTAVISVSDKTELTRLGEGLAKHNVKVIATEGSAEKLRTEARSLNVIGLSAYTEFPENFNGRLKTLHPKIQAGVLAIKNYHDAALKNAKADYIDLVVVNLYPFENTVRSGASPEACIENIDIGGPALIRGGAKNHPSVCVVCDPNNYSDFLEELDRNNGCTTLAFRRRCAQKAFELTSRYDAAIAKWFSSQKS